jgi:hypothetical protein
MKVEKKGKGNLVLGKLFFPNLSLARNLLPSIISQLDSYLCQINHLNLFGIEKIIENV